MWAKVLFSSVGLCFLFGCTIQTTDVSDAGAGPTANGPPEPTYCAGPATFSGSPVTITGTAKFNRRDYFSTSPSGLGSANPAAGTHPASVHNIRYAEVRVSNAAGTVVQCTETLGDGTFSFTLPNDSATYT